MNAKELGTQGTGLGVRAEEKLESAGPKNIVRGKYPQHGQENGDMVGHVGDDVGDRNCSSTLFFEVGHSFKPELTNKTSLACYLAPTFLS